MMKLFSFSLAACVLLSLVCDTRVGENKEYHVNKIEAAQLNIDGKGSSSLWSKSEEQTDFTIPWFDVEPQATSFKALWSDDNFYFLYVAQDSDVVAPGVDGDERGVLPSDRVELFFKANGGMDPYYCLELDPRNRVLDYIGRFYRDSDFDWNWPAGHLEIKASINDNGYIVEGRISMESLKEMEILQNNEMITGLFRGDYNHVTKEETEVTWITWVHGGSEKPDFHIKSVYGKLILQD